MELSSNAVEILKKKTIVHYILSHAYMMFFFAVIFGILFEKFTQLPPIAEEFGSTGFLFMVLGSVIIYWAQSTSGKKTQQMPNFGIRDFALGPYKYSRNPTHIGLALLTFGFAIIMQSFLMIALLVIAYTVTKLIYIPKEEKLLEAKYGEQYLDYKKKVSSWL